MLRELADIIAMQLLIICNQSWRLEEVPEDWRKANINPSSRRERRRTQGTTGQSTSLQSLGR